MNIRFERVGDEQQIRTVNTQAFARTDEADLVDALRAAEAPRISLVAEDAGAIVGHALFTVVTVRRGEESWQAAGLGPVAVLPAHQSRGIGGTLVRAGMDACLEAGYRVLFVLGHPDYYPRFGFVKAAPLGLIWDQDAPSEAWMVAELAPGALCGRTGIVSFRPEFTGV